MPLETYRVMLSSAEHALALAMRRPPLKCMWHSMCHIASVPDPSRATFCLARVLAQFRRAWRGPLCSAVHLVSACDSWPTPLPQSSGTCKHSLQLLLICKLFLRSMLFWATQQRLFRQMLLTAKVSLTRTHTLQPAPHPFSLSCLLITGTMSSSRASYQLGHTCAPLLMQTRLVLNSIAR